MADFRPNKLDFLALCSLGSLTQQGIMCTVLSTGQQACILWHIDRVVPGVIAMHKGTYLLVISLDSLTATQLVAAQTVPRLCMHIRLSTQYCPAANNFGVNSALTACTYNCLPASAT